MSIYPFIFRLPSRELPCLLGPRGLLPTMGRWAFCLDEGAPCESVRAICDRACSPLQEGRCGVAIPVSASRRAMRALRRNAGGLA